LRNAARLTTTFTKEWKSKTSSSNKLDPKIESILLGMTKVKTNLREALTNKFSVLTPRKISNRPNTTSSSLTKIIGLRTSKTTAEATRADPGTKSKTQARNPEGSTASSTGRIKGTSPEIAWMPKKPKRESITCKVNNPHNNNL
jgi:hypothetical protein